MPAARCGWCGLVIARRPSVAGEVEAVNPVSGILTRGEIALALGPARRCRSDAPRAFSRSSPRMCAHSMACPPRWPSKDAGARRLRRCRDSRVLRPFEAHWDDPHGRVALPAGPAPASLEVLESARAGILQSGGASALARAYFGAGQYARALATRPGVARSCGKRCRPGSLAACGCSVGRQTRWRRSADHAWPCPLDGLLLRAELEAAARTARCRTDRLFETLTARPDAESRLVSSRGPTPRRSGDGVVRILGEGSLRFPTTRGCKNGWLSPPGRPATHHAARSARAALSPTVAGPAPGSCRWKRPVRHGSSTRTARAARAIRSALRHRMRRRASGSPKCWPACRDRRGTLPPGARWRGSTMCSRGTRSGSRGRGGARTDPPGAGPGGPGAARGSTIIAGHPELPSALKLRGGAAGASGQYAEAVSVRRLPGCPSGDFEARRQQARIEGWRGAYDASRERYAQLREREPQAAWWLPRPTPNVRTTAATGPTPCRVTIAWLALEPDNVEAQIERAQALDRLGHPGDAVEGFRAVTCRDATPNDVSLTAADRIERRRAPAWTCSPSRNRPTP